MQVFIAVFVIVAVIAVTLLIISNRFGGDTSSLKRDLTAERLRSNLAQTALRQIAAGDAMPVLRAETALQDINTTYNSKEIA